MKVAAFLLVLLVSSSSYFQSGRRAPEVKAPVPAPAEVSEPAPTPALPEPPPVTAEKNEDYRCSEDGTLARILDKDDVGEQVLTAKDVDVRAVITSKPKPSYTREARRLGIQGFVTLRVLLSARSKIDRVRVIKGLRSGLTENAMRAACRMEFKPAIKGGQPVAQWLTAEYVFRLAESSIFTP
jgi:periplasmic protein TonB